VNSSHSTLKHQIRFSKYEGKNTTSMAKRQTLAKDFYISMQENTVFYISMCVWPKLCLHSLAYFIALSQIKQLTPSTTMQHAYKMFKFFIFLFFFK